LSPIYPEPFRFPPDWPRRPEGMHAPENAVWQAFRLANLARFTALYFNVHCGTVPGLTPTTSEAENRARTAMWAKRADVVAELGATTWVIECKAAIRASSIGQALSYGPLIAARKPQWKNPRVLLIGATIDPDAASLCASLGLECYTPQFVRLADRAQPATSP
jgi:hypothetical protein